MAKQSSILIGTRKAQELKNAPPVKKSSIDLDAIKENNAKIHKEKSSTAPEQKVKKKRPPKVKPEKLHRVSLDLPDALYKKVKLASLDKGITMRQLLIEMIKKI